MDGGSIAKNAYRYQDWCAMYFALEGFEQGSSFERIYCEQNKLDFEIWQTSSFIGFQVKTTAAGLTAREINRIFLYYKNKSGVSGKPNKEFKFIFGELPIKSLAQLFIVIRDGYMGASFGRRVQKFIDTSLENIPVGQFTIGFHNFDQGQIRKMVYSQATKLLQLNVGTGKDFQTKIVDAFISSFRDKIDEISCRPSDGERMFKFDEIGLFIKSFTDTFQAQQYTNEGRASIKIEVPPGVDAHISISSSANHTIKTPMVKNITLDGETPTNPI
jgi:hypothetical protein